MKILLSLIGDIIGTTGGVEKVLCNMANAMAERGHDVTIMAFVNKEGKPFFALNDSVEFCNMGLGFKYKHLWTNITNLFMDKNTREFRRLMTDCRHIADRVDSFVSKLNPDIIVAFEQRSVVLFNEYIKPKAPVITMFHFNYSQVLKNEKLHYIYKKSSCIQVLTKNDLNQTKNILGNIPIVQIANAVPQYKELANLREKRIITVGRIESNCKRQHLLIKAFAKIFKEYPEWRVEIYGDTNFDPKYYQRCLGLIKKLNLSERVRFCGVTNNVKDRLLKSSIFAFPSRHEGFGLALAEALSVGVPAVGYKSCPGTNELIIDRENGLLCEDGVDSFTDALVKLIGNDELRRKMGVYAKQSMQIYSPNVIWNEWEKLLYRLSLSCS